MKKLISFLTLSFSMAVCFSQKADEVTVTAYWEIGDSIGWHVTNREEFVEPDGKRVETTQYDAILTVLDSTADKYDIRWVMKNVEFQFEMDPAIKSVLNSLPELPLLYETDEFGSIERLKNWKYLRYEMNKAMDRLRLQFPTLSDTLAQKIKASVMSSYETEEQLMFQMADVRYFHYLFGVTLGKKKPLTRTMFFSNSYLNELLPAEETIKLESLNEDTQVAHISVKANLTKERNRELVLDYIKEKNKYLGKELPKNEDIPDAATSLKLDVHIDLYTGYILNATFWKKVTFNDGYFEKEMKFELMD